MSKMTEKAEWYTTVYKKAWKIQSKKYENFCICGKPCSGLYSSHKLNCKKFEKSVKSKTEKLLKQTGLDEMFEG